MSRDEQSTAPAPRESLYALLETEGPALERIREALILGCSHLGVEAGYVLEHGADGTDTVTVSVNGDSTPDLITEGSQHNHQETYCRRTVEEPTPVALSNAPDQGWADDPAYQTYGLCCYLGASVFVRGEVYGTVCFVSRAPHDRAFDETEKVFVELVARTVGRLLETERHEAALEASRSRGEQLREKYRTLLETVPDAAILADTDTGAIVDVNETTAELVGYEVDSLREMSMTDFYAPDLDEAQYVQVFNWFVENGGVRSRFADGSQIALQRRDGTTVPVEVSGNTVDIDGEERLLVLFRDISERRDREANLRVFQRALNEAAIGVTIADANEPGFPLRYANEEFCKITGYDQETALGRNCNFLQGEATSEAAVDRLRHALEEEVSIEEELINYRAEGTPFWNRVTITPVHEADGETVSHFVGFQQDVTAQKRQEEFIGVLNRLLRHNLRNELTAIAGYAGILADELDGETQDLATQIGESATELSTLAEKARSLEKVMHRELSLKAYDIIPALETVVTDLREEYPGVEFEVEAPATAHVIGHGPVLRALRELCDNAAKHGGSPVQIRVTEEADGICVEISDTGAGLSDLERKVIEEGTETPLKHSLGVGLWLVNWIVTGVGGTVETAIDDGTTVTLQFTAAPEGTGGVQARYQRAALNTNASADSR